MNRLTYNKIVNSAIEIESNRLYPEILKYTATLLHDGVWKRYIERYNQSVVEYFHEFHKTLNVKKE